MKFAHVTLCASVALLTACGGGGSSTPAPSPAPTATATPTPSPSPSPPSTPNAKMPGGQACRPACVNIENGGTGFTDGVDRRASASDETLFFTQATQTWAFDLTTPGQDRKEFGPADQLATSPPGRIAYERANLGGGTDAFTVALRDFRGLTLDYVRGTDFVGNRSTGPFLGLACVFGVPTVVEDQAPTSVVTYSQIAVSGVALRVDGTTGLVTGTFDLSDSTATFEVDPDANSQIETIINVRGREILANGDLSTTILDFATNGSGQAAITTEFGTDNVERGAYSGTFQFNGVMPPAQQFTGWFYGPQGVEAGYGFAFKADDPNSSDEFVIAGQVFAKR